MVRREPKNLPHGRLGVFDRSLPVAGNAVIDPGIGELWRELDRGRERLLGARRLIVHKPCLTVNIMRTGIVGRAVARLARSRQRGLHRSPCQLLNGRFQKYRALVVRSAQFRHVLRNAMS